MKKLLQITAPAILWLAAAAGAQGVAFAQAPQLLVSGNKAALTFAASQPTDAEVAILDAHGKVVRHLAAGYLGGATPPPEPLDPGLAQGLEWDGLDDYGAAVSGGPFSARVRLGVRPQFERSISTKVFPSGITYGPGGVVSNGELISETHPVWKSGWSGGWAASNGTTLYATPTKLDLTVSDETDDIFVKCWNSTGLPLIAQWTGASGQFKKVFTAKPFLSDASPWYGEPTVSWDGKFLWHDNSGPRLYRFNLDGTPANFAFGTHYTTNDPAGGAPIALEDADYRQRGITTGPDGSVYCGKYLKKSALGDVPGGFYAVSQYDREGKLVRDEFMKILGNIGQGIRVDLKGNIFLGVRVKPAGKFVPDAVLPQLAGHGTFTSAGTFAWWGDEVYGSILKFGPSGGSLLADAAGDLIGGKYAERVKATGMRWMHFGASFQPTYNYNRSRCVCHAPRFDVDRFGRVIFPNAFENQFVALDNNGNPLFKVHNRDLSMNVQVGYLNSLQATDRGLYAVDYYNNQVISFTWKGEAEAILSVPLAVEGRVRVSANFLMNTFPNPARSHSLISYSVPAPGAKDVRVAIYDARHKLVRTLAEGALEAGRHRVSWDCRDGMRKPVGNGVYYCRVTNGKAAEKSKIILLR